MLVSRSAQQDSLLRLLDPLATDALLFSQLFHDLHVDLTMLGNDSAVRAFIYLTKSAAQIPLSQVNNLKKLMNEDAQGAESAVFKNHLELKVLHVNKDCVTHSILTLEFLLDVHAIIRERWTEKLQKDSKVASSGLQSTFTSTGDSLRYILSRLKESRMWVEGRIERVNIDINLVYNMSQQRDNKTNMKIAHLTTKIAQETQKDSSSMIT